MSGGFADLRIGDSKSEDSVWPSFADVMTVIVMIFLISLAIILVRNIELDRQLVVTTTVVADREKANQELSAQLQSSEGKVEELSTIQSRLQNQLANLSARFADLETRTSGEIDNLTSTNLSLAEQIQELSRLLKHSEQSLQSSRVRSAEQLQAAAVTIDELTAAIKKQRTENDELKKLADASSARHRSLAEEYAALDEEYRKLIRPARNRVAKYVVEVYLVKIGGELSVGLKLPNQNEAQRYNEQDSHLELQKLKDRYGEQLYTKIIIPERSELSHNEAWRLTQEILDKFDYYYQ